MYFAWTERIRLPVFLFAILKVLQAQIHRGPNTWIFTSEQRFSIGIEIILTLLCRSHAQTLWEALCACWPPVRIGFRTSAGRRCLQRAAQDRTCSWSPSRSSNVLMTLPRQPSSLSPSPQRRIPTKSTYRAAKPSASQFCSDVYCIFNEFVVFVVYACIVFLFFLQINIDNI